MFGNFQNDSDKEKVSEEIKPEMDSDAESVSKLGEYNHW